MRITEISVKKLFGRFNHTIPLNLEDRTTIIFGPNGVGKTVLFKLVDGLFNDRYSVLHQVKFDNLVVIFADETAIDVSQTVGQRRGKHPAEEQVEPRVTLHYRKPGRPQQAFELKQPDTHFSDSNLKFLEHFVPEVTRTAERGWTHDQTGELLSLEELLIRYRDRIPPEMSRQMAEPDWWTVIKSNLSVRLIDTQRLSKSIKLNGRTVRQRTPPEDSLAVSRFAAELSRRIKDTLAQSGQLSDSLDRTLLSRLVNQELRNDLSDTELKNKLSALEMKRARLKEAGLLGKDDDRNLQVQQHFDEKTRSILSVHVQDVEKKLAVFDDIADKIDLFKEIIKDHFKYKFMVVEKDIGFAFVDEDQETTLHPQDLSSGEQQEVVLLYELLFRIRPNSLILVDEPELSLHVVWQREFLHDIQRIAKISSIDVLLATHSPQIIHDRWDLTVQLGDPEA